MALRRTGDRAVLLLAKMLKSVDKALRNPLLSVMLRKSQEAQDVLTEARAIVADAKAEGGEEMPDLARGIEAKP